MSHVSRGGSPCFTGPPPSLDRQLLSSVRPFLPLSFLHSVVTFMPPSFPPSCCADQHFNLAVLIRKGRRQKGVWMLCWGWGGRTLMWISQSRRWQRWEHSLAVTKLSNLSITAMTPTKDAIELLLCYHDIISFINTTKCVE